MKVCDGTLNVIEYVTISSAIVINISVGSVLLVVFSVLLRININFPLSYVERCSYYLIKYLVSFMSQ